MEHNTFRGFTAARPIYLRGYDGAGNCQAGFAVRLSGLKAGEKLGVWVTAGTFYRLYVNGVFAAHGPARTAENYLRVDALDVTKYVRDGDNIFAFEIELFHILH